MDIDRNKYKVWDQRHWSIIHIMVNPGLAFNELVLGQRIPKLMLIDKTSDKPLVERSYIPCPHCNTYHDGRTWSYQNGTGFKNWFGLYCPNCGAIIPCVRNWTAALLMAITYPLWFWWVGRWKESWLRQQPERYANIDLEAVQFKKINWVKIGMIWGGLMFVAMTLVLPPVIGVPYELSFVVVTAPVCLVGGLLFGLVMKWLMGKKARSLNKA